MLYVSSSQTCASLIDICPRRKSVVFRLDHKFAVQFRLRARLETFYNTPTSTQVHVLRSITILSVCYLITRRRGVLVTARRPETLLPPGGKRGLRAHNTRSCKIQRADGYMKIECVSFLPLRSTFSFLGRPLSVRACFISTDNMPDVAVVVGRPRLLSAGEHLSRDQCIYCRFARRRTPRIVVTTIMPLRSALSPRVRAHQGAYAARCRWLIN